MPWCAAAMAKPYVPILFAASPFAALAGLLQTAFQNADLIEISALDAVRVPAAVVAGLQRQAPLTTAFTLSLDTPEAMGRAAAASADRPLLKVKLGGGSQYDIVGVDALWVPKFYEEGAIDVIDMGSWPQYSDMFDEFKKSAYQEADIDTIRIVRELAAEGRLDANFLN